MLNETQIVQRFNFLKGLSIQFHNEMAMLEKELFGSSASDNSPKGEMAKKTAKVLEKRAKNRFRK